MTVFSKLTLFVLTFHFFTWSTTAAELKSSATAEKWTLGIGGDAVLCRRVERVAINRDDFAYPLGDLAKITKACDVFFCNLECQISDRGKKADKGENYPYHFRAQPSMVKTLKIAGVDVVSIANNHGMDYGPEALLQTIEICRANEIEIVGGGRNLAEAAAPRFVNTGDLRLAFVAFQSTGTTMSAGLKTPGLNSRRYQESELFLADCKIALEECRDKADLVVFSVHWGPNYRDQPTKKQRRIARSLLDMGYDVIVAHSAHQFLGVEIHKGKPIIHDAGNFIADFKPVEPHWVDRNMIFQLHFAGKKFTHLEAIPIVRASSKNRLTTKTVLAKGTQARTTCRRLQLMCIKLGTKSEIVDDRKLMVRPIADR